MHDESGFLGCAGGLMLGAALVVALPQPAQAISFESPNGKWYGSWDTTLSYGLAWRMERPDAELIGLANGGNAFSVNNDDGTLNFNRSIYSNTGKITTELALNNAPGGFGFFFRGYYFYDWEIEDGERQRTELSAAALRRSGSFGDVLDAFFYARFDLGPVPGQFRIGEQVINWGESTFIQGGMNVINHINVAALRVPGAELREALLPQDLIWVSLGLLPDLELELVYQYDWDDTEPDPVGTYFATNDFVPDGGTHVFLAFGDTPDTPNPPFFTEDRPFNGIPRAASVIPDDNDQFGGAIRWFLPDFNNGTELGFYYYKYHSRLPLISAQTGSFEGLAAAAAIGADPGAGGATDIAAAAGAFFAQNPGDFEGALAAGRDAANAGVSTDAANAIANAAITGGDVSTVATAYATDAFANTPSTGNDPFGSPAGQTANYLTEFPEDIELFGISFNTTVGQVAVQGEIAHHRDRPLQIDDLEVLFAGLSPLRDPFAEYGQLGSFSFNLVSPQFNPETPPFTRIVGYKRLDYSQLGFSLTRLFGPVMGADQAVLLFEGAWHHVHGFPDRDELRFNGPGTVVSGNDTEFLIDDDDDPSTPPVTITLAEFAHPGKPIEPPENFASQDSYGYRLAGRLDFNNAIGPINVSPRFSWQHDVEGITPGPGGAFLEGRRALTVGSRFTYQNTWEFDVSYTTFYGAGRRNLVSDRDFLAASIKFTF